MALSALIGADEQRTNVLQKLEAACGGRTIRLGGRWMFQAVAYYGPYDFEITEYMVVGTITGSTEPTNDDVHERFVCRRSISPVLQPLGKSPLLIIGRSRPSCE